MFFLFRSRGGRMSFSVSVRDKFEDMPLPDDPDEIDAWMEKRNEQEIYDAPVASDGIFFEFWHLPAVKLKLELLSSIYQDGLMVKSSEELNKLDEEIDDLTKYWNENVSNISNTNLIERANNVKRAIRLAREDNKYLII